MASEHLSAQAWMEKHSLTKERLSELTGFSPSAIYWLLKGKMAPGRGGENPRKMNPFTWHRFKRLCHSVEIELRTGDKFDW